MSCYFLLLIVKKYIRISLVKLPQLEPFCFVLEEQYVRPIIEHHVLGGSSFWIVMKFLLLILAAFVVLLKKSNVQLWDHREFNKVMSSRA